MSESPICPYCDTSVPVSGSVPYDSSVKMTCSNCGGLFEYHSGFGTFPMDSERALPPLDHKTPDSFVKPKGKTSGVRACGICVVGLCFLFIVLVSLALILRGMQQLIKTWTILDIYQLTL